MFYQLPPAGNRIDSSNKQFDKNSLANSFSSEVYFFSSGAASLAVTIMAAVQYSNLERPEVLLPAYACPELVSAILYAGAKPVLVDLAEDRPWMDLAVLSAKLTEQTCAVIAVSLFGIPERLAEIRQALRGRSICLIEDSAQAFPEKGELPGEHSDFVIYSFGRGKPVSVLGGGAILIRNTELRDLVACIYQRVAFSKPNRLLGRLKIELYNLLISPQLYWLLGMLPFIQLGTTFYHPLREVKKMDESRLRILNNNIEQYWLRGRNNQDVLMREIANRGSDAVTDLGMVSCNGDIPRLLRYPLLAMNSEVRDELYESLNRKGLGSSKMYPTTLQYIDGLEQQFLTTGSTPNAESFSKRLLTLPIHDGVSEKDLSKMLRVIC